MMARLLWELTRQRNRFTQNEDSPKRSRATSVSLKTPHERHSPDEGNSSAERQTASKQRSPVEVRRDSLPASVRQPLPSDQPEPLGFDFEPASPPVPSRSPDVVPDRFASGSSAEVVTVLNEILDAQRNLHTLLETTGIRIERDAAVLG